MVFEHALKAWTRRFSDHLVDTLLRTSQDTFVGISTFEQVLFPPLR
jgi:hypothetical protein